MYDWEKVLLGKGMIRTDQLFKLMVEYQTGLLNE